MLVLMKKLIPRLKKGLLLIERQNNYPDLKLVSI
jgi:hypothetical protein